MRKTLKCISIALILSFTLLLAGSCKTEQPQASPKIFAITGPSGVGMVHLMEGYTVSLSAAPDEIVAKVANGEAEIAALPTNVASSLYNKLDGKITVLCVSTLGVLYMMDRTGSVSRFSDLEGKTIYSTGEGANPQYILEDLLKKNYINATVKYLGTNDELTAKMISGEIDIAMVPQPVATTIQMKSDFKPALDMTAEWNRVNPDSQLMMGCVVARTDYLKDHKKTVKQFLKDYQASVDAIADDPAGAAALCETYGIIPSAAIAEKAIPYCNITFVTGQEMKDGLSGYLQVLYDANPQSIGGALPGDRFYYGT